MPQCDVLGSYVIIMQFADVDVSTIQSKFWRMYITIFQWNEWFCIKNDRCISCIDNDNNNDNNNNIKNGIEFQMRVDSHPSTVSGDV